MEMKGGGGKMSLWDPSVLLYEKYYIPSVECDRPSGKKAIKSIVQLISNVPAN